MAPKSNTRDNYSVDASSKETTTRKKPFRFSIINIIIIIICYLLIGIRKTKSYKNQSQVHLNKIKLAVI